MFTVPTFFLLSLNPTFISPPNHLFQNYYLIILFIFRYISQRRELTTLRGSVPNIRAASDYDVVIAAMKYIEQLQQQLAAATSSSQLNLHKLAASNNSLYQSQPQFMAACSSLDLSSTSNGNFSSCSRQLSYSTAAINESYTEKAASSFNISSYDEKTASAVDLSCDSIQSSPKQSPMAAKMPSFRTPQPPTSLMHIPKIKAASSHDLTKLNFRSPQKQRMYLARKLSHLASVPKKNFVKHVIKRDMKAKNKLEKNNN